MLVVATMMVDSGETCPRTRNATINLSGDAMEVEEVVQPAKEARRRKP